MIHRGSARIHGYCIIISRSVPGQLLRATVEVGAVKVGRVVADQRLARDLTVAVDEDHGRRQAHRVSTSIIFMLGIFKHRFPLAASPVAC